MQLQQKDAPLRRSRIGQISLGWANNDRHANQLSIGSLALAQWDGPIHATDDFGEGNLFFDFQELESYRINKQIADPNILKPRLCLSLLAFRAPGRHYAACLHMDRTGPSIPKTRRNLFGPFMGSTLREQRVTLSLPASLRRAVEQVSKTSSSYGRGRYQTAATLSRDAS